MQILRQANRQAPRSVLVTLAALSVGLWGCSSGANPPPGTGSGGQQARFSIGLSVLAQTTMARGEAYFVSQNRRCLGGSIEGVPAGVRTTVTLAGASNNGQNNAICALPFTSTAIEVIYPNQSPVSVSHSYTFAAR